MEQKIKKNRNNSIDIFRLICAILVIVIHTNPFAGLYGLEFITHQILPRVAVPFFFAISGFFYFQTLQKENKVCSKYLLKILITYICWSVFYFLINFIQLVANNELNLLQFIKSCVISFLLTGSYYHFWFFPALIFSILLVSMVYKLKGLKILYIIGLVLYLIGCLGCAYYDIAIKIPGVSTLVQNSCFTTIRRILMMGLPFFLLGTALSEFKCKWEKIKVKSQIIVFICIILAFVAEILLVTLTGIYENIVLTIFLYPLVGWLVIILHNNPAEKQTELGKLSRSCAEFTYYIHPAIILFVQWIIPTIFGIMCSNLILFLIVAFISVGLGILWMKLNIKENLDRRNKE